MHPEPHGTFSDPLVGNVLSCTRELLPHGDLDQLLRASLELARSRLGVDRCALWLLEPDGNSFRGTWGTSIDGSTTDEHDRVCSMEEIERELPCRFHELEGWVIRPDPHRYTWKDGGNRTEGRGWNTIIPVVGPLGNTGLFFQDSAIAEKPIDPRHQDMVTVYCALLGQVAGTRAASARASDEDLHRVLEAAEDLLAPATNEEIHRRLAERARELVDAERTTFYLEEPGFSTPMPTWTAFRDGSAQRHRDLAQDPDILCEIPSPQQLIETNRLRTADIDESSRHPTWAQPLSVDGRRLGTVVVESRTIPGPRTRARFSNFAMLASRILDSSRPGSPERRERGGYLDLVAGGIAHDFNNLLAATLGNIELLLEVTDLDRSRMRQRLEDARSACLRGRSLAQRLLTLARGGSPVIRPVDPLPFLMEAVKSSSGRSGLRWRLHNPDHSWMMLADEGQIGQVVQNLVVNACQWQGADPSLDVFVANRSIGRGEVPSLPPGRYVQIDFQDSGPGVPESMRSRIFDPYFSTRKEGSGLGLATCRSIAERHRGSIECLPSESGALFRILLPATEEEVPSPAPGASADGNQGLGGKRVLVMDDEPTLREMLRDILESQGLVVATAAEGRSAVEQWMEAARAGSPFDLGLFDLVSEGGMGGIEASRRILSEMPTARILVCSGNPDDPAISDPALGIAGSLAKPFRMSDLLDACEKALRRPTA